MSSTLGRAGFRAASGAPRWIGARADTAVRTVTPDPNRAVDSASRGLSKSSLAIGSGIGVGGLGIGGGLAGGPYFSMKETEALTEEEESQRSFIEETLRDDDLSDSQKERLLDAAIDRGLFSLGDGPSGGEGDDIIPESPIVRGAIVIIVVYFGARLVSNRYGGA